MKIIVLTVLICSAASLAIADTDTISPGDNLVLQNIPPIPAKLADDLRPYTEFRGAGFTSWHPTRREMLIYTRFADVPQIHHVKFPGGARTQLTFFNEPVYEAWFQPTAGDYFVFDKDTGGNEQYQKYRFQLQTGLITLLTDGKSRNTDGIFSNDGKKFAYESTRRTGRDTDIWMLDPSDPKSDRMIAQLTGGGWTAEDFSPDDKQLIVREFISANETYLWLLDIATGEKTLIIPKDEHATEKISYDDPQFSRDGKAIYCSTDRDSEFHRLTRIDLATKQHTVLSADIPWDITGFRLSWDGKLLAYVANEDGLSVLRILDIATGKNLPQPKLPAGIIGSL